MPVPSYLVRVVVIISGNMKGAASEYSLTPKQGNSAAAVAQITFYRKNR